MSEPTLDDDWGLPPIEAQRVDIRPMVAEWSRMHPETAIKVNKDTPEFDRIATEQGYVKRPVCGECEGDEVVCISAQGCPKGEPGTEGGMCDCLHQSPCPSCGGTGFGRLVAIPPDAVTIPGHYWIDGLRIDDPTAALVVIPLAAIDQEEA